MTCASGNEEFLYLFGVMVMRDRLTGLFRFFLGVFQLWHIR